MSQSGVPQVGDRGNGAQGLTPEQIAEIRAQQPQQQVGAVASPPTEKEEASIVVSELDRVKAENLHLRLLIAAYKVKDAQTQYLSYQEEQSELQAAIVQSRAELQEKYGIDLEIHEIRSDTGLVVPRGQSQVDFGQLMQRIAMQQKPGQPQA